MASPIPEGIKRLVRYSSHPAQVRLDRAFYYHHRQRKEIRAIDNLQAQWAEHFDAEEAKEKAGKQEAPRPPLRRVTRRLTVKNENTAALLAKYLAFVNDNPSDLPAVADDNYSDSPATANDDCPHQPALVNNDCTDRFSSSDRSCYSEYSDRPALDSEFGVACVLDYHAFLFERYELFSCKNPTCQLHMRCGMGAMPSPRNKAWQILNLGGFKN
ncbi:hypothetical protein AYO22_00080 [Fonsecaea multimorphosa]|nr:hypothetical protein AYO22_00080 [Fonsecaea multimorphosa]